jgi:ABC-type Fe3+-hydroxamate transport system substrate-binding protein
VGAEARIVSLVPSLTELLFDLGLDDRIVGRTHYCIHPSDKVRRVPSVGGTKKVKLARLRDLAPTHVVVNIDENPRETVEAIAAFTPNVVVTHPIEPHDNLALYRLLGGIFGREAEAEALCDNFAAGLRTIEKSSAGRAPLRVLYLIWKDPWMTVSRDTYVSRMLALVDWRTVGHQEDTRYPVVDLADELWRETDLVLLPSEPFRFTRVHLEEMRAARLCGDARLALIDGEMVSWYGSRAIRGLSYLDDFAARYYR